MDMGITGLLARYARPLLLLVPGLLTLGAALAMVGMPLAGWLLYGAGQFGLLVALPALWAAHRSSIGRVASWALLVAWVGLIVAVPVMAMALGYHLENPADPDVLLGYELGLVGVLAVALKWAGIAIVGYAAFSARSLRTTAAVALLLGGVLALLADLGVLVIPIWALGVLIVSIGLVSLAPPEADRRG